MISEEKLRVYVAGSRGFMGRNFMELAKEHRPEWTLIAGTADVSLLHLLTQDIWKAQPDCIVNFASKVGPAASFEDPKAHIAVNLEGTLNLIAAAGYARAGVRFVQVSTSDVYGDCRDIPEDGPLHPRSPYGMTKAAADLAVLSSPDVVGMVIRPSSAYGPYDRPERMIPRFISQALRGEFLDIYGLGNQVRKWTYVDDISTGIIAAIEKGAQGKVYHLSADAPASKIEIAKLVLRHFGHNEFQLNFIPNHAGHPETQTLDCTYTKKALGWDYVIPLKAGLEITISDLKAEFKGCR